MPHLVSIISDQAVPNLLFIRQFAEANSHFYFISSQEMEEKQATENLKVALKLPPECCHTIVIDADDVVRIHYQLNKFNFPIEDAFLVNITGGNKLMSQMVFSHFQSYKALMFYAPINSDFYQQVYPQVLKIPKDPGIKLSLDEYLYAYGFEITGDLQYFKGNPKPTTLFWKVLDAGGAGNVPEIAKANLPGYKDADKNYLLGNWFELYCYQFFKRVFHLNDSQIGCSVGLKKIGSATSSNHDNEFDLMFIFKNDLYVFECKVYTSSKYSKDKYQIPMYKLASLTQKFGLKCKKYLAVLAELPEVEESLDQLEQLRTNLGIDKLITLQDFMQYQDNQILTPNPVHKPDFQKKLNLLIEKFNG
ncbi:Card1-like endonuclease domain-containing protein [Cecembia calidifontis]|uniref:Uncharacterized protein DUF1887 n=1 Tax=Cecembia calidifontis TaxID=1187080 RepID=A0A4Q7PC38_9BACT|nr:DUF1887 family CARF protein [Cecembia calidifontis]RZS97140.1 uncharacterized protein DUF1887 [Cecembia calidifontis]